MTTVVDILEDALSCDEVAKRTYGWLAPAHRASFVRWIEEAAEPSGRRARVAEAVEILAGRDRLVIRAH
jgi:uncharacterized protein YdeI (YjbR/CyaY-like superfamily)